MVGEREKTEGRRSGRERSRRTKPGPSDLTALRAAMAAAEVVAYKKRDLVEEAFRNLKISKPCNSLLGQQLQQKQARSFPGSHSGRQLYCFSIHPNRQAACLAWIAHGPD